MDNINVPQQYIRKHQSNKLYLPFQLVIAFPKTRPPKHLPKPKNRPFSILTINPRIHHPTLGIHAAPNPKASHTRTEKTAKGNREKRDFPRRNTAPGRRHPPPPSFGFVYLQRAHLSRSSGAAAAAAAEWEVGGSLEFGLTGQRSSGTSPKPSGANRKCTCDLDPEVNDVDSFATINSSLRASKRFKSHELGAVFYTALGSFVSSAI